MVLTIILIYAKTASTIINMVVAIVIFPISAIAVAILAQAALDVS